MQEPGFTPPPSQSNYSGGYNPIPSPTASGFAIESRQPGIAVLKRVDVASACKLGAVLTALMWAVFGLLFVMFGSVITSMMAASGQRGAGLGMVGGFMAYLFGIIIYGIVGGIVGAVYALIYNLVAGWVGGLEVELG